MLMILLSDNRYRLNLSLYCSLFSAWNSQSYSDLFNHRGHVARIISRRSVTRYCCYALARKHHKLKVTLAAVVVR